MKLDKADVIQRLHNMVNLIAEMPDDLWTDFALPLIRVTLQSKAGDERVVLVAGITTACEDDQP